ncbi:hypothetical protein ACFQY7_22295 [Actinomadura luteofluorescens]|uniref:hypothetical protein n=1 Tax=Actinomadura luteofluorescens TaxID=46163 RepID=UPI003640C37F
MPASSSGGRSLRGWKSPFEEPPSDGRLCRCVPGSRTGSSPGLRGGCPSPVP